MNLTYFLLIDIGLFLVTLFIIVFVRQIDKKDRQIHLVKTLMENMRGELDEKFKKMRTTAAALDDSVQSHEIAVHALLKKVDGSLTELDRHAGELQKLQSYTSHYHRILSELSTLTQKAEKRLQKLKVEMESVEDIEKKVETFTRETAALEERITLLDAEIAGEVEKSRVGCIDGFTQEVDEKIETAESRISAASEIAVEMISNRAETVGLLKVSDPEPELAVELEQELEPEPGLDQE